MMLTSDFLTSAWNGAGLSQGDCVLLHSNVKRWTRELLRSGNKKPLETIFDSFLNAVGEEGTLIFPLFNFDFTSGVPFRVLETPSQMGALTEFARSRANSFRSGHPVYSFCAFGKYADNIHSIMNKSAYADDSPFGFLRQFNGKIAVLDLEDQGSMTFYHHVEEICGVDYRYDKVFTGDYVDRNGLTELKEFSIYVRDIDKGVLTHVNPAGEDMWRNGIYKGDRPGEKSGLRTAPAVDVFDYVKQIIDTGRAENMLFRYSQE